MSSSANPRKRVYCPHCDEYLSKSAYYQHKLLYYDEAIQKWSTEIRVSATSQAPLGVNSSDWVSFEFSPALTAETECREEASQLSKHRLTLSGCYDILTSNSPF